jgi:predicted glycosyltransferase
VHIWIDFSTAPDPLFFRPLIERLHKRGHTTWLTAREFSETTRIARACGLQFEVVGEHGGSTLTGKSLAILKRAANLTRMARREQVDLALGFNSYAQAVAARIAGIPLATCMDYEYQPANHIAFRLARRVIVPHGFDIRTLRRQGGTPAKVVFHDGLKEHVTLADFQPDQSFPQLLAELGIDQSDVLVTMRPPATQSSYHRFENALFDSVLQYLASQPGVKVLVLPRYASQADQYRQLALKSLIVPEKVLDGLNLVYWSDLVISAGGSMNREAVVLGTPAYTVFKGTMAGVDQNLIADGLLGIISEEEDVRKLPRPRKKDGGHGLAKPATVDQVVDAILGTTGTPAGAHQGRDRRAYTS